MNNKQLSTCFMQQVLLCAGVMVAAPVNRVDAQNAGAAPVATYGVADVYIEPHVFPDGTPRYVFAILPLPTFGGLQSQASGINNLGWVTGNATYPGEFEQDACIYRDNAMFALDGPQESAMGTEINDLGEVAGQVKDFVSEAGFWDTSGRLYEIPSLNNRSLVSITDLSDHGEVVAIGIDEDIHSQGLVWQYGEMTLLPLADPEIDYQSRAFGINDLHQVVGNVSRKEGTGYAYNRAVIWEDGVAHEPPGWQADGTVAKDINELGYIVGYRLPNRSGRAMPCIWTPDGETWELKRYNPDKGLDPIKINNRNQVLASYNDPFFLPALDNTFRRLLDYYPPKHLWEIKRPNDLNDHGQIVGTGFRAGISTGWIATPVTPTFNLSSVTPGTVGEVNTMEVSAAPPGAQVTIVVSSRGGGTMIPGCTILDNALQLDNPRLVGTGLTDANGRLTIEGIPPAVFAGHTLIFQAFIQDRCEISNLVLQEF